MHKILIGIVNFGSFFFVIFYFSFPFCSFAFLPVRLFWFRISKVNSFDVKILDGVEQTFRRIVK